METTDLELKEIDQFSGTENYYKVMGADCTDGVIYLMQNGYSWVVTDALVICRMKLKGHEFVAVHLEVNNDKAKITYTDGNSKVLFQQKYKHTNAGVKELMLFYTNNVLMLSGEY